MVVKKDLKIHSFMIELHCFVYLQITIIALQGV